MKWITAVRVYSQRTKDMRGERDHAIRMAHQEGFSLREIAAVAALSHGGVKKIIDRPQ